MSPVRQILRRNLIWPLLVATLVIAASHRPHLAAPDVTHIDKVTHFAVYGLLATLFCRIGQGWRAAWWGLAAASLFGITDELHQALVPGRQPSVADWVADTLGAAVAVMLYWGWAGYRRFLEWPIRFKPAEAGASIPAARPWNEPAG